MTVYRNNMTERIVQAGNLFTPSERIVADFIIRNPQSPAFWPAARLGQEIGVSESTVVRFARAMGYAGYPELQEDVRAYIHERLGMPLSQRLSLGRQALVGHGTAHASFHSDIENLRRTSEVITQEQIDRVSARLGSARRVYIVGSRASAGLAGSFAFGLTSLLSDVRSLTHVADDVPEQILDAGSQDVVVAITFARPAHRTLTATRLLRETGCHIVAITDNLTNPVVQQAHETLLVYTSSVAFLQSYTAPYAVCGALLATLGNALPDAADRLSRLESILVKEGFVDTQA